MQVTLNNIQNATKMITFTEIPTIITVESEANVEKKAKMQLRVGLGADIEKDYYIQINDVKILGTSDMSKATGNSFWYKVGKPAINANALASAYTIARALNNTPLSNNYNIYVDGQNDGARANVVILEAKTSGVDNNFFQFETNCNWISMTSSDGATDDVLAGATVICDVYAESSPYNQNAINSEGSNLPFISTFQKTYYKNEISFNLSPILSSIATIGSTVEYNIVISYIKNNELKQLASIKHNYAVPGYQVNLGKNYINNIKNLTLAQNVSRGSAKSTLNNTTLYYVDKITLSLYSFDNKERTLDIKYLDTGLNEIGTDQWIVSTKHPLNHLEFTPMVGAAYVDILLPEGTLRYTNILPNLYTNPNDIMTIYWFNSYGGMSFFPFTMKKEENRESERTIYRKSNSNYYTDSIKSYNKVYSIDNDYEVTLQTHFMDKDGTYSLNDLQNSMMAWTVVDGKKFEVIIKSVTIEEQSNNGIFLGTVKFSYSLPDRF